VKKLMAMVLALTLTGCASYKVEQAAVADTVTTAVALSRGAVETNPMGFAGATALKVAILANRDKMEPETREAVEHAGTAIWGGAAVNNLAVILGSAAAAPLGVLAGIILWFTY
jgi:hypothetical protein